MEKDDEYKKNTIINARIYKEKTPEERMYVDKQKMFEAFVEWKGKIETKKRECSESGLEYKRPKIPDYIGKCIYLIAVNLGKNFSFSGYTYKDEMISDAIENSLTYIENFNPAISNNPFSYFTQVSYFAFLRRIAREKKNLYIRYKSITNSMIDGSLARIESDESEHVMDNMDVSMEYMDAFVKEYEMKNNLVIPTMTKKEEAEVCSVIEEFTTGTILNEDNFGKDSISD